MGIILVVISVIIFTINVLIMIFTNNTDSDYTGSGLLKISAAAFIIGIILDCLGI